MSFQKSRIELAAAIEDIVAPAEWAVTTGTEPELHHKTIVVGHPLEIDADTFQSWKATVPVTLWVSEADDAEAVDQLYELLSPGPMSLLQNLPTLTNGFIDTVRARDVGRRDEGPSGFLAADVDVVLKIESGLNNEARW